MNTSTLPNLPKQLDKREAKFGIQFRRWIESHKGQSCPFELKRTMTSNILFSCLKPNQIAFLLSAKSDKGILIRVIGIDGEPDYAYYRNSPARVVIRYPKSFHVIDIDTFLLEKKRSIRRSLTEGRARELSTWSVDMR